MTFWRVRATVDDRPGYLSVLTASLALRAVNILSVQVHATEAGAVDDFLVDAPDALTEADLVAAVVKGRGRDVWVGRADVRGLADTQTQLLGLAARLVRDPDELGAALAALLSGAQPGPAAVARKGAARAGAADAASGCEVSWSPQPCPAGRDYGRGLMRLPDPAGGTLLVRRDEPPFTPAEFARAHALVDLAAAVLNQATRRWQLLLPGGGELTVRPAGPQDAEAVLGLRAGYGAGGRYRMSLDRLTRQLEEPGRITLVAEAEPEVVAVATLVRDGTEGQVDLLVAGGYRRRGVGGALLYRLARLAAEDGIEALHAYSHPDDLALMSTMRRLGLPLRMQIDGPMLSLSADLCPDPPKLTREELAPEVPGGTGTPCPAP